MESASFITEALKNLSPEAETGSVSYAFLSHSYKCNESLLSCRNAQIGFCGRGCGDVGRVRFALIWNLMFYFLKTVIKLKRLSYQFVKKILWLEINV